ncbi:MAG: hypothetical protein ACE5HT_14440 [Gemmatimonadales bacterium]
MNRTSTCLVLVLLVVTTAALAQQNPTVRRARQAYDALDFEAAIRNAKAALKEQLSEEDRVNAYELLGFSYGALDSARQAVDNFRELIFLDPDREPDVTQVSPRITSLYASALGQVLVVRRLRIDSVSFVAGDGEVDIRFQLSRPARAIGRAVGPAYDVVIDSQLVAGTGRFEWDALDEVGNPVPPGSYEIIIKAVESGNEFAAPLNVTVTHASVDTLDHLLSLPGYSELPETETPPRSFRPFGIASLYAGLSSGAALALENSDLNGANREIIGVSAVALVTGFIMSLKKPDPRPVPANIRYNQLLREDLQRRNEEIVRQNSERRREVLLTIAQTVGGR